MCYRFINCFHHVMSTFFVSVPEGPPLDISLIATDSTSVLIQWLPPSVPMEL